MPNVSDFPQNISDQILIKLSNDFSLTKPNHLGNFIYMYDFPPVKLASLMQSPRERPELLPISKSLERFRHSFHSTSTERTYLRYFNEFLEFIQKTHLELVSMDAELRQWNLEKWVISLNSRGFRKGGIITRLAGVEKFLDMNRCIYFKKPLHALVKDNGSDEIGGNCPYTTDEIRMMLEYPRALRTRALIQFYASTGARTNAISDPELRIKHLFAMSDGCYAVRIYDNSKNGYSESSKHGLWVFLTPEARNALDDYLNHRRSQGEEICNESPLFASQSKKKDCMTVADVYRVFKELFPHVGIKRIKIDDTKLGRFDKATIYGFRKRFETILVRSGIKHEVIEKLMGHKSELSERYFRPTKEELFSEFLKIIPELTIGTSEKLKLELESKSKRLSELELAEKQKNELAVKVEKLERALLDKTLGNQENVNFD